MTLALEGVRLIDFGQYLAGPFGPMILGDLGAEVIKVEPVTGDGMRLATKPFFGCQRGKRDIALNVKDPRGLAIALELVGDRRRRAPQHDGRRRDQARHRLHRVQEGEARHRLLQHVGVRPRRSARALRWARPAVPGVVGTRARVGARCTKATRRSTTASACATRRTRCCRSSRCSARCTTASAPARARRCGRRCSTAARSSPPTRTSSAACPRRARTSTRSSWASPRPTGSTARRTTTGSASPRSPTTSSASLCTVARRRRDRRRRALRHRGRPRRAPASARDRSSSPVFRTKTATFWTRTLDDAGVPNEVPFDTHGGEAPLFDSDNVELGLVARYDASAAGRDAPVRRAHRLLRDARPHRRPAAARRPGHARDAARARPQRPRDRRADRRQRLLRARRPLRRTLRRTSEPAAACSLLPPGAHTGFLGDLCVPDDLYWIAREPVALAGMSYPGRADWSLLHEHGIGHVVCLSHDGAAVRPRAVHDHRDPAAGSRERRRPERSRHANARSSRTPRPTSSPHLERGIGVAVHCMGGRGRTGTVIGVALVTLGHDPDAVIAHLDRVARARGRRGWPESPWQSAGASGRSGDDAGAVAGVVTRPVSSGLRAPA